MNLNKLDKKTAADLKEEHHQEYKGYEFVVGHINQHEGLDACYVWDVNNAGERVEELGKVIPDGANIAAAGDTLGWDYGTFGTTVDEYKRIEDCRNVIDKLNEK